MWQVLHPQAHPQCKLAQCWKDDRTSTRWELQVCPESQITLALSLSMAESLGARTPGWLPQSEHCSRGCRKAENFLEVLTASEPSHKPDQLNSETEKLLAFHRTAALSCGYNIKQQEALSIWRPRLMVLSTLQGLVHGCWLLGKFSNTPLFPQYSTHRLPTLNRAYSKSSMTSLNRTCFQGQNLSSFFTTI